MIQGQINRRLFTKLAGLGLSALVVGCGSKLTDYKSKRPNILLAISDDQSHIHTSFAGSKFVKTPAFDRIAAEGVYFTNCYASSPGCAPSRSSLITGRHHWQNEQSGQHYCSWMKKHIPFTDELRSNGYSIGRTGKGVGPFQYARNDNDVLWRKENAAGPEHSKIIYNETNDERPATKINNNNYVENFKYFMENVRNDKPFFFWYGAKEPHRDFEKDSWKKLGKKLEDVTVPDFLPDNEEIRGDLLDYAVEIEWFDLHLQRMLEYLKKIGELDNTIVIVTSDNGMAFPRAKANCYEYGMHVPLAIRYPKEIQGNRISNTPISFIDIAPTVLEVSRTTPTKMMSITGKSIWNLLTSKKENSDRAVFSGRERHSSSRYSNWGYPQRSVRKGDYIYTWNAIPDRWPAGAPQGYGEQSSTTLQPIYDLTENEEDIGKTAFTDIDGCPTKTYLIKNHKDKETAKYLRLACDKRPEFELFNIKKDSGCLNNLSGKPEFKTVEKDLKKVLFDELKRTNDPRVSETDFGTFDTYKRYYKMRKFPKPINGVTLENL